MANYYVRTDGNDTTGDGSTGTPWATLTKALGATGVPTPGGHTLWVGSGTYAENDYLTIGRFFLAEVIVRSESGNPADVIIRGSSNATYNTFIQSNNLTIRDVTLARRVATNASAVRIHSGVNLKFINCIIQPTTSADTNVLFDASVQNTYTMSGVTFQDCVFNATAGRSLNLVCNATSTMTGIVVQNCTMTAGTYAIYASLNIGTISIAGGTYAATSNYALYARQVGALTITGGTFTSSANAAIVVDPNAVAMSAVTISGATVTAPASTGLSLTGPITALAISGGTYSAAAAISIGVDGVGTAAIAGTVSGVNVASTTSHNLLIGGGCDGITVNSCTLSGGDNTLVLKECTNVTVTNNTLSGNGVGINCKGATSLTITNNRLTYTTTAGYAFQVQADTTPDPDVKCQNVTFIHNTITVSNAADALLWGDDDDDAGGGVCDYNVYRIIPNGVWGSVRGTTVSSLAELRAAWDTYENPGNDEHSRVGGGSSILRIGGRLRVL